MFQLLFAGVEDAGSLQVLCRFFIRSLKVNANCRTEAGNELREWAEASLSGATDYAVDICFWGSMWPRADGCNEVAQYFRAEIFISVTSLPERETFSRRTLWDSGSARVQLHGCVFCAGGEKAHQLPNCLEGELRRQA
jgi:hypothetical protein